MPISPVGGIVTPESTGRPVVHEDLANLARQAALLGTARFATVAQRTAAFGSLGITPPNGTRSWVDALGREEVFFGGFWCPTPGTVVGHYIQSVAQSAVSSLHEPLELNGTDLLDLLNAHDPVTNNTRFQPVGYPGRYTAAGSVGWAAGPAATRRGCRWSKTGVVEVGSEIEILSGATGVNHPSKVWSFYLNGTTDYIEMDIFFEGGGALLTAVASNLNSSMHITYAGFL